MAALSVCAAMLHVVHVVCQAEQLYLYCGQQCRNQRTTFMSAFSCFVLIDVSSSYPAESYAGCHLCKIVSFPCTDTAVKVRSKSPASRSNYV